MSRGQGRLFRPKVRGSETSVWWLDYSVGGQRFRESSGTDNKTAAGKILRQKHTGRESGTVTGPDPRRVTFGQLRELIERQYVIDGNRSLDRMTRALAKLEAYFGKDSKAAELTAVTIDGYAEQRLKDGAARATVNYELAGLRRMFRLAVKKRILAVRPEIELPKVHNERQGFFEEGDFAALLLELAPWLRPAVHFAKLTGWRLRNEVFPLAWDQVDWEGEVIRVAQAGTKGGEARLFPFGLAPDLKAILEAQWAARKGLYVFHRNGKRLRSLQTAWRNACRRAGLEGRIPHDLRRTAARDFRRAGVSEGEIMKLCGWRTRSMFDRYNIIDEADLAAAVARRFSNGKQTANKEGDKQEQPSVS